MAQFYGVLTKACWLNLYKEVMWEYEYNKEYSITFHYYNTELLQDLKGVYAIDPITEVKSLLEKEFMHYLMKKYNVEENK